MEDKRNIIEAISFKNNDELKSGVIERVSFLLEGSFQEDGKPFPHIVKLGVAASYDEVSGLVDNYRNASISMAPFNKTFNAEAFLNEVAAKFEGNERFELVEDKIDSKAGAIYVLTYREEDQVN